VLDRVDFRCDRIIDRFRAHDVDGHTAADLSLTAVRASASTSLAPLG
jgi:hypothetical protein